MARRLPLKYRIAVIVFILEAIMVAIVLGVATHTQMNASRAEFATKENVLSKVVTNLSRTALLTQSYDQLQAQIEQLVEDPHIIDIEVANRDKTIVASSNVLYIGRKISPREDDHIWFWRTYEIYHKTGTLGTVAIQFSHLGLLAAEREAVERGWWAAALFMTIFVAISIVAVSFLTRRLEVLSHAASRIADGDLSARAEIRGNGEIAFVGKIFDRMAESIGHAFDELHSKRDELQRAQNELEQRVAERTAELAVARDYALNANHAKGAFLANMSHELRTPLNAIIGYSEMLWEAAESENSTSADDQKRVLSAANHLLTLINNVLDLAKIDAGKMDLHLELFEIHEVVRDAAHTIQPIMTKNKNRFQWNCPDNFGKMMSDRTKVYQCLLNLLSNAAKYTDDGDVECRVTRLTEDQQIWIEFVVRDTGIGIPENKMNILFHEFSQMDSSKRHQSGTGLGLVLTRRMARLLGGDVSVLSQAGQGSTFTLRLPEFVQRGQDARVEPKHALFT